MRGSGRTLAVLVAFVCGGCPGVAGAQWLPFDNFDSGFIDPARWFVNLNAGPARSPTAEVRSAVIAGQLKLRLTQYGSIDADTGTSSVSLRVSMVNPSGIGGMKAGVVVNAAEVGTCPVNPAAPLRARAQLSGFFFNDGSSSGAGDRTGDVGAGIQKMLDATLGASFEVFITRCANAACSPTAATVSAAHPPLGWLLGDRHKISVAWDQANNRFLYTIKPDGGAKVSVELPYAFIDSQPPAGDSKRLTLFNSAVNCTSGRKRTLINASFDGVKVMGGP